MTKRPGERDGGPRKNQGSQSELGNAWGADWSDALQSIHGNAPQALDPRPLRSRGRRLFVESESCYRVNKNAREGIGAAVNY